MTLPDAATTPRLLTASLLLLFASAATACDDDVTSPGDTDDPPRSRVSLSVALAGSGSGASGALAPGLSITQDDADGNQLTIDRVAFVLSEIELEAEDGECPEEGESDDCEELERGPTLVDFEPNASEIQKDVLVQEIPERFAGRTFTELEFELEAPDEDEGEDPGGFLGADVSVLVEGAYDGSAFTYESDVEAEQERPVSVEISEGNPETNVTLSVDVGNWFRAGDGTLVDPGTAGDDGENEDLVEDNIEASFDAFEDEDEDGEDEAEDPDEDEDGDDADDDGGDGDDGDDGDDG